MVIKQLVIQILDIASLNKHFEDYSEQLLLKNILKTNFGSESFAVNNNNNNKIFICLQNIQYYKYGILLSF